jgi:hypothetical protein
LAAKAAEQVTCLGAARAAKEAGVADYVAWASAARAAAAADINRLLALDLGPPGMPGISVDPSEFGPLGPLWPEGVPDWVTNQPKTEEVTPPYGNDNLIAVFEDFEAKFGIQQSLFLDAINHAKEELSYYKARYLARVNDPGANLRHCTLSYTICLVRPSSSKFQEALWELRQLGKDGNYTDENIVRCIEIMLSELDAMYAALSSTSY